jgi:RNA polymerase sigma factor (sigma-70 family)
MSHITRILSQLDSGDPAAADQLLPLVYDELRQMAAAKLARERPGQTLQPTALVHEAYLRLVQPGVGSQESDLAQARPHAGDSTPDAHAPTTCPWRSRRYFFGAAAEAMRRILVDRARRRKSERHGGGLARKDLDTLDLAAPEASDDLLALDEALCRLAAADEQAALLVRLRYFAGLTVPEVAETLGISPRTADRLWAYARAFLHAEIYEK